MNADEKIATLEKAVTHLIATCKHQQAQLDDARDIMQQLYQGGVHLSGRVEAIEACLLPPQPPQTKH